MGTIQKIFKLILPKRYFEKIQAESKMWFFVCDCGYEKSVWDSGGLRFAATPKQKPIWGRCPVCHKFRKMKLVKK